MNSSQPKGECIALAAISGVEGVALIGYALYDGVQAIRIGITGPVEVSNGPALLIQILIFMLLGVGLLLVARGWLRMQRWARSPFVLAQLIALLVGFPLAQASTGPEHVVFIGVLIVVLLGAILAVTPPVGRALAQSSSATD